MMQATAKMALFTIAEADTLRRAIGKKSIKDIPLLRDKFINGCIKNNISQKDAENVFSIFENAGYAFNLSHSLSYSIIAAQTCFLKTYYPIEFLCASLTREAEKHERVKILIEESNKLNIGVLRPDINKSENEYIIEENKIRYGFNSIKGLGHSFTESILKNRKSKYTSFADFIRRISENEPLSNYKAKIQILIESGCFDSINHNRNELLSELMFYLGVARSRNKEQKTSLFDIMETKNLKVKETLTVFHKRNLEETHLGVYFS
jgi:DNA polymerase-3 subunit alpha